MTSREYNQLTRPQSRARDAEIKATLTGFPAFVEEWDEYAALTVDGEVAYGETFELCRANKIEYDELKARKAQGA